MKQFFVAIKKLIIIPFLSVFSFLSCGTKPPGSEGGASIKQGIAGKVQLVAGNQMPSPDAPYKEPKGIKCKVFVHALALRSDAVIADGAFFSLIRTPLIKSFESAEDGSFAVELPVGDYSVVMGVDSLFYSNLSDQYGHINPVRVGKDSITQLILKLDHKAVY